LSKIIAAVALAAAPASAQAPVVDCSQTPIVPPASRAIAVGGVASAVIPYDPTFDIACFLDSSRNPAFFGLNEPGVLPPLFPSNYAQVEAQVLQEAARVVDGPDRLILIGYSHGATMALRVAHRLQMQGKDLGDAWLVLIDRIPQGYPLDPALTASIHTAPPGLRGVLNIFQTLPRPLGVNITPLPFSSARGAPLQNPPGSGIQNFDVSLAIALERDKARRLAFNTTFPAQGLSDHHHYIAWSLAVRRLILLETFGIPYLGGVWSLDINGTVTNTASGIPVPVAVNRELVVQEHNGSIQLSKEPDPPFNSILTMRRTGTGAIEGTGWEVSLNPCSILGNESTVTTPTSETMTLGLTGVYDCGTSELFWDGNFAGSASGRLLIKVDEPLLPGAPSGYSYSAVGSTVLLRWLAPSTGGAPLSYRILAGLMPGNSQLANFNTGNTATSFVVTGVPPGTYFTRVVAQNAQGTSAPSNEIAVVVTPPGLPLPPGPPVNYSAMVNGSTVILTWLAPATGGPPSSYRIRAGSAPGASDVDFNTGNTALSLVVSRVPPGTYFTRIVAVNAGGTGAPSNEITVVVR
jgi:hypothetical protein